MQATAAVAAAAAGWQHSTRHCKQSTQAGAACATAHANAVQQRTSWPRRRCGGSSSLARHVSALPQGLEASSSISGSISGFSSTTGFGSGAAAWAPLEGLLQAASQHAALYSLESLLIAAAAYAAAVWPDRPRGWCIRELVEVRSSPVAGKGVFAVVHIAAGTVVGAYPGRPRTPAQMAAKCETAAGARDYCFRTRSGLLLDPTDDTGHLSPSPGPGLPWIPVDVTLAYVNEPPKGAGGTNVSVEDDPEDGSGLLCVAARDIRPGEELFMDYGIYYDRTAYSRASQQQQQEQREEGVGAGGGREQ